MAQPNSFNRNPLTQLILTTDGRVEELPIGSLRVPPPVGFQAVCGGVGGGLCLAEQCWIGVEGGLAIFCGLVTWPAVCITLVVLGVAITVCMLAGSIDEQFRKGCAQIDAIIGQAGSDSCNSRFQEQPGETLGQKLLREFDRRTCLQGVKRKVQEYIEELRKRLYGAGGPGPGTTQPGANPYFHM